MAVDFTHKKPMNTSIKTLFLAIFTFFINCTGNQVLLTQLEDNPEVMTGTFASNSLHDFNNQLFDSNSLFRVLLTMRVLPNDSKLERTEVWITSQKSEFIREQKRIFPQSQPFKFKIETRIYSGQLVESMGPTGFTVVYNFLRTKFGEGNSLTDAWLKYKNANYKKDTILRYEKWESIKDGIWLAEEKDETKNFTYFWDHSPGSFDFLHRYSEFKSGTINTASLNYDYSLNRLEKVKIENFPDPSNLVFEDQDFKIQFVSGKLFHQP